MPRRNSLRNPLQPDLFTEIDQLENFRKSCESEFFLWNDIIFERNQVKLHSRKHVSKIIPLKGSLPLLDKIKDTYFERLIPKGLRLYFFNDKFQIQVSKSWSRLIELIEPAIEYAHYRFNTMRCICNLDKLSNDEIIKLFHPAMNRSEYLKCLALKQSVNFSIIPIIERNNNHDEECFLFRLQTINNRILFAWESSKDGRATHFFITKEERMEKQLTLIESFIISDEPFIRSTLHSKGSHAKEIKKNLVYIGSLNHRDPKWFKSMVRYLLDKY